jgi:hypothetical protein
LVFTAVGITAGQLLTRILEFSKKTSNPVESLPEVMRLLHTRWRMEKTLNPVESLPEAMRDLPSTPPPVPLAERSPGLAFKLRH